MFLIRPVFDTPPHKCGRCSVLCRSLRHGSPKSLPGPPMFFAAFSSRSNTSPHLGLGQMWVSMDKLLSTRPPQPLQSWLV